MTSSRAEAALRFQPLRRDLVAAVTLVSLAAALACAGPVESGSGLSTLDPEEEAIARYELRNLLDPYSAVAQVLVTGSSRCVIGSLVEVIEVTAGVEYDIDFEDCGLVEGSVDGVANQVIGANGLDFDFDFDFTIDNTNYDRALAGIGHYQRDGGIVTLNYEVDNSGVRVEVDVEFDTIVDPERVSGVVDFSSNGRSAHCELDYIRIIAQDQVLDDACGF